MRLQPYKMHVVYRPGKENPADYLSRHPHTSKASNRAQKIAEEYIAFVAFVASSNTPCAVTIDDVRAATPEDPVLRKIGKLIHSGRWHERPAEISAETFKAFRNVKDSLSMTQDIIPQSTLIVIPSELQDKVIKPIDVNHVCTYHQDLTTLS